MTKETSNTILESIRNMPGKRKHLVTGTSLALMLCFSSCGKKEQDIPKKLGEFEWVDEKGERDIYKYKMKSGDYPLSISAKFNKIDDTTGDDFITTGALNILDKNQKEIQEKQVFQIGETIHIKAKKNKEKESEYNYNFSKPENYDYRGQREKGGNIKKTKREITINGKREKIEIIKDAGLTFYVVQENDFFDHPMKSDNTTINHCINFEKIIQKLSQIDEFSYLQDSTYQRSDIISEDEILFKNKLNSFNINPTDIDDISKNQIKKGNFYLPIPTQKLERSMNIQEFSYYAQQAIEEMLKEPNYKYSIKELLSEVTREEILEELITFAYSESSPYGATKIGEFELHRWEGGHNAFSFSYFHILMTEGSAGYRARINLGLSEGECYHPKNATKLFLAYRIETAQDMKKPLDNFFPLNNSDTYEKLAAVYNGPDYKKKNYHTKLSINHKMVLLKLKEYKKNN